MIPEEPHCPSAIPEGFAARPVAARSDPSPSQPTGIQPARSPLKSPPAWPQSLGLAGLHARESPWVVCPGTTKDRLTATSARGSLRNDRTQWKSIPPFIPMTSPVTNAAAGEARNTTALATSSGVPSRPSGMPRTVCARPSGVLNRS